MSDRTVNNEELEALDSSAQSQENQVDELESTTDTLATEKLEQALAKEKDQYLRLFAEFDNFKKRTAKERLDFFKTANKEVIVSLLPVLDDFTRGLKEIEKSGDDVLLKGIELIYNKLVETLRSKGLKPMETNIGDDFDTDKHEAITQIPSPELKGKVVDVVETGYLLNDVVVRYAKVVVGM